MKKSISESLKKLQCLAFRNLPFILPQCTSLYKQNLLLIAVAGIKLIQSTVTILGNRHEKVVKEKFMFLEIRLFSDVNRR